MATRMRYTYVYIVQQEQEALLQRITKSITSHDEFELEWGLSVPGDYMEVELVEVPVTLEVTRVEHPCAFGELPYGAKFRLPGEARVLTYDEYDPEHNTLDKETGRVSCTFAWAMVFHIIDGV